MVLQYSNTASFLFCPAGTGFFLLPNYQFLTWNPKIDAEATVPDPKLIISDPDPDPQIENQEFRIRIPDPDPSVN